MKSLYIENVNIYYFRISDNSIIVDELLTELSKEEVDISNKFVFDKDKENYIICRGNLRRILSNYLQLDPKNLEFSYNKYGKPYLPKNPIKFNLSHSGDFCVIAVTKSHDIGVDIEKIEPSILSSNLLERILSKKEMGQINKYTEEMKLDHFYDVWTQKESLIKANGKGLSFGLKHWSTEYPKSSYTVEIESKEYSIHKFEVDNEYKSALCISSN